jgi:hypothetical protein
LYNVRKIVFKKKRITTKARQTLVYKRPEGRDNDGGRQGERRRVVVVVCNFNVDSRMGISGGDDGCDENTGLIRMSQKKTQSETGKLNKYIQEKR